MPFLEEDMCFGKRKRTLGEGSFLLVWNHAAGGAARRGTKEQRNKQTQMDWESSGSKTILSTDLSDLDRTMLVDGLLGSEADEDRLQAIVGVDRRRRVVDDGFDELIDFVCISHHVALEKEEHRLLGDDAMLEAVDGRGLGRVGDALCVLHL